MIEKKGLSLITHLLSSVIMLRQKEQCIKLPPVTRIESFVFAAIYEREKNRARESLLGYHHVLRIGNTFFIPELHSARRKFCFLGRVVLTKCTKIVI